MISQECKFSFFRVPSGPHSYCLDNFCQSSKQCALSLTWQLIINMHTINAVFLLVDTALNCLVSGSSSLLFISVDFTSISFHNFTLILSSLPAVPLVSNRILFPVDSHLCCFPMDRTRLFLALVN